MAIYFCRDCGYKDFGKWFSKCKKCGCVRCSTCHKWAPCPQCNSNDIETQLGQEH
jgi:hypothetical protein